MAVVAVKDMLRAHRAASATSTSCAAIGGLLAVGKGDATPLKPSLGWHEPYCVANAPKSMILSK